MKIAFIGTHGVGKTTMCFDLASALKRRDFSVDIVKEVARECPLPINKSTTLEAQLWILHTQCAREITAAERFHVVICDRSVIDNYAYLVHRFGRQRALEPLIASWLKTYHLLVKVPIWRPPSYDGLRDTDRQFQKEIDALLDNLLFEFQVAFLRLQPEATDSWLPDVIGKLGLLAAPAQLHLFG